MGQMGFFDIANRYAGLDAKNDPLVKIDEVVPWEDFRPRLEAAWRKPAEDRKSPAGRKPWDTLVMFKAIVLCALYNLSDDQVEYQLRDRLSFMRFLGLGLEDRVPDAKTVWLYREHLAQAGVIEALFDAFDGSLKKRGYLAMGGQIIDASIVPVPQQRNSRDENARIKDGETPEGWEKQPAKRRQKDTDARWTKKHGKSPYGYKNHVNVDRRHKLVRRYQVTDAAVHDSQAAERAREAGQRDPFEGAGSGGARLRGPEQRHGRDAGARHRAGAGQGTDRAEEPRLQHAPPSAVGAPRGGGATVTVFRAGVRAGYEFRHQINRSGATERQNPEAG